MTSSRAIYLYAVVPRVEGPVGVTGIGGSLVELVQHARLGLVASEVELDLISEVNNDDVDTTRLGQLASNHDAVVRGAAALAQTVLPFRFGMVVRDRTAARRLLEARADVLESALHKVATCWEWGVRVDDSGTARQGSPDSKTSESKSPAETGKGAGTAYLLRRRQELAQQENERDSRARAGEELERDLRESVVEVKESSSRISNLHCKTCLVRGEDEPAFFAAVDRCTDKLAECGLRLTLTGPWPPYSFVPGGLLEVDHG